VILYHELSHAYHIIKGDQSVVPAPSAEIQSIADENQFRKAVNLPQRHPTDHFGEPGTPAHGGVSGILRCKPEYPGFNWDCIVATAAVGAPYAPQVAALRRGKHEYRGLSLWTALIAEPALKMYGSFSPGIVREMNNDPALRAAMRVYAVVPVFHLVRVAETYLAAEDDTPQLLAQLDAMFDEYVRELMNAGGSALALKEAAAGALAASRMLRGDDRASAPAYDTVMPRDLFTHLTAAIKRTGETTTAFAWAMEGIALFLTEAARKIDGQAMVVPEFLRTLGAWIARLPMPPADRLQIADARKELRVLASRVFTRPDLRNVFAQRLLSQWPATSAPDLQALLGELGFISSRGGEA
jgi:hypothetical protein